MHFSTLIPALVGLGLALDAVNPPAPGAHLPVPGGALINLALAAPTPPPHDLSKRGSATCTSKIESLAYASPTPTGSLSRWQYTVPGGVATLSEFDDRLTSLCTFSVLTPPPSLSSAYAEHLSRVSSYYESARPVAKSLQQECGKQISAIAGLILHTEGKECEEAVKTVVDVIGGASRVGSGTVVAAAVVAVAVVGVVSAL